MSHEKLAVPTNKWIVTQITALAALITAWVTAGQWDKTLTVAAIGVITQAIVGYLCPNTDTPGGVPRRAVKTPLLDSSLHS